MSAPRAYAFGPFCVDLARRTLTRDGEPVPLAPKPFSLLAHLLRHQGHILSKEHLIDLLWKDGVGSDANLNVNISAIRRALGERPADHRYVVTVPMKGYIFVAPVEAVEAGAGKPGRPAAATGTGRPTPHPPRIQRLAVLPFTMVNPRPDDDHLGKGLVEAVIDHASGLRDWAVQSMRTVLQETRRGMDTLSLARSLEVDAVLEGVFRRDAGSVSIAVTLYGVEDGAILWSDTFGGSDETLARLPERIGDGLARVVEMDHRGPDPTSPSRRYPKDLAIFQEYLRGRFRAEKAHPRALTQSLKHFHNVQEADPDFAPAYVAEAEAFYDLWRLGHVDAPAAGRRIEAACRKALDCDATLGDPFFRLGFLNLTHHGNRTAAEALFARGFRVAPNSSLGHTLHAYVLLDAGRPEQALEEARLAQGLEPGSLHAASHLGTILRLVGRLGPAVSQLVIVLDKAPDFAWGHVLLGRAYLQSGRFEDAVLEFEAFGELSGQAPWFHASMSLLRGRMGDPDAARAHADQLSELARTGYVEPYVLAFSLLGLGEPEPTLAMLERAYRERPGVVNYLRVEPLWADLHGHPEFEALRARTGERSAPMRA